MINCTAAAPRDAIVLVVVVVLGAVAADAEVRVKLIIADVIIVSSTVLPNTRRDNC